MAGYEEAGIRILSQRQGSRSGYEADPDLPPLPASHLYFAGFITSVAAALFVHVLFIKSHRRP